MDKGAIYGLGLIGALVFYIKNAGTLTAILGGILKALVWPAIIVYKALALLG